MQRLRTFSNAAAYLILLAPLVVLQGVYFTFSIPRFAWLLALVPIFFLLALAADEAEWQFKIRRIDFAFSAFVAIIALSLFWTSDLHASLWSDAARTTGVSLYVLWFVWFFGMRISPWTELQWKKIFGLTVLVAALVAAWSIGQVVLFGHTLEERVSGPAGNALILATYLAPCLALCVLLYTERLRWALTKFEGTILLISGFLIAAGVALSFSRSSYLGLIVGFVVGVVGFLITTRRALGSKKISRIVGVAVLLIVGTYGILYGYSKLNGVAVDRVTIASGSFQTLDTRLINWKIALRGIRAHPILGAGWENYRTVVDTMFDPSLAQHSYYETRIDKPHNVFLEVWVTTGTIGFLIYLALIYLTIAAAWRLFRAGKLSAAGVWTIIGFFVAYHVQNFFAFDTPQTLFVQGTVLVFLSSHDDAIAIIPLGFLKKFRAAIIAVFAALSIWIFIYAGWGPLKTMWYITDGLDAAARHNFNDVDVAFHDAFSGVQGPYYFETWRWFGQTLLYNYATNEQKLSDLTLDEHARWDTDVAKITELTRDYAAQNPRSVEWQTFAGKMAYYIAIDRNDDVMLTFAADRFLAAYAVSQYRQEPPILLSYIYGLKGENAKAIEWYTTAVKLTPSNETKDALNFLLPLFVKTRDNGSMVTLLERATTYQPDAETYAKLAAAYADVGRYDDARRAVDEAVTLDSTYTSEAAQFISTFPSKK